MANKSEQVRQGRDDVPSVRHMLVVGENSFEYSLKLRQTLKISEIEIVSTSYETKQALQEMGFSVPKNQAGFKVMTEVDATNLGRYFGPNSFNLIIFNNPRAVRGWFGPSGDLIQDVLKSAPSVLKAGGIVRFSTSARGPAAPRLRTLASRGVYKAFDLNEHYEQLRIRDYTYDEFGVQYQPRTSKGKPFASVKDMKWYQFRLKP